MSDPKKSIPAFAHDTAFILYEGKQTPHRSCGICLAETFNVPTRPYQSLRKGGITGKGECGAIKAGELIIGEYLGDPDPTGAVTDKLRAAANRYRELWQQKLYLGKSPDHICENLTGQFSEFTSPERMNFCTNLAADVAAIIAQVLGEFGADFQVKDIKKELGIEDEWGELNNYRDEQGRLTIWASSRNKKHIQHLSLTYLISKFEFERDYTEREVNELLNNWHTFGDPALLRRELYEAKFLGREKNGSRYWRLNHD